MKKKLTNWIAITLASLAAIGICYAVGVMLSFTGFAFSWTLNFTLMAWYTYVVSHLNLKLDSDYFKVKPFERGGQIYKYVGVHAFRKLLSLIGWERINGPKNPFKNNLATLKVREYNTRSSELGHAIIALIVYIITLGVSGSWDDAKWLLIMNLLFNIYPIMLQRFNRPRYRRIINNMIEEVPSS